MYTGSSVNALTRSRPTTTPAADKSAVRFQAVAGTTYSIAVDGKAIDPQLGLSPQGSFQLRLGGPPANDEIANAQYLGTALPLAHTGSNLGARKEPDEANHGGEPGGASVWLKWTAPGTGSSEVTIDGCGSPFSVVLGVYSAAPVPSDRSSCGGWTASVTGGTAY